jgi:hypothetical protein
MSRGNERSFNSPSFELYVQPYFRSRWLFVDVLDESEFFLVTREPPAKCTTWASEVLPEEALKTLRPQIRELLRLGVTGTMVGVEFVNQRIAPLQHHRRPSGCTARATTSASTSASSTPTPERR